MTERRSKGQGSCLQRPSGKWQAQVCIDGQRLTKTFRTKTEGDKWIRKQMSSADQGTLLVDPEKTTVQMLLTQWLDTAALSVKPKTLRLYSDTARLHLIPTLGKIRLVELRPDQVQKLYTKKLSEGLSARSVEIIHGVLNRALIRAQKWGLIARVVTEAVTAPRPKREEIHAWTPDEARRFLDALSGDRLHALYTVALNCGLRQGELRGLRWEDVDLAGGSLQVRRTLQRIAREGIVVGDPKSSRGRRQILLPPSTIEVLRRWKIRQLEERLLAGEHWIDTGYVFTSSVGTALEKTTLTRHFQRWTEKLALPKIRFHDLRHTCATMLLSQGIHPKVVQEMLGHSQISLTMDTYSHVLPTMQEEAARAMERLLGAG